MNNTWSLTESFYVFYSYDMTKVYLANPESKKFWSPVKKISESTKSPECLKNDGYKIKFESRKVKIEISGKWYQIANLDTENLLEQLSEATIQGGISEGVMFGFSPLSPEKAILLLKDSTVTKEAESEFMRRVNLSLYSKTTSYKPGHKYSSDKCDYWYLGKVVSHKSDKRNSSVFTTSQKGVRELHAFTSNPGVISEIYKTYSFLEFSELPIDDSLGIVFLVDKKKSMVDLGEEIKISGETPESLYEARVEEYMNTSKEPYSFGSSLFHYNNFQGLISIFEVSSAPGVNVTEKTKDMILEILRTEFRYILFRFYDLTVNAYSMNVLSSDSIGDRCKALVKYFTSTYTDNSTNYYQYDFVVNEFKVLFGIDIIEEAKKSIEEFTLLTVDLQDFDNLIDNFRYLEHREPDNYFKNVDFIYTSDKNRKFEAFIKPGEYLDTIKDIYKKALDTCGENLKTFGMENIGTVKTPSVQYTFMITLEDILKHYGVQSLNDLPEDLKKDMVDKKIYSILFRTSDSVKV